MRSVSEKLDILYLFRVLSKYEILEKMAQKEEIIEMSDECKNNLQKIKSKEKITSSDKSLYII